MVGEIVMTGGVRTPFCRSFTKFGGLDAMDLGMAVTAQLLKGLDPKEVDRAVWGNVLQPVRYPNLSRVITCRSGMPDETVSYTMNMNCASGLLSIIDAYQSIALEKADVVLAGGVEAMSNANLELPPSFTKKVYKMQKTGGPAKLGALAKIRPRDIKPGPPSYRDPISKLTMGETAEILAKEFGISRKEQDRFALASHKRAVNAMSTGRLAREIVPVPAEGGKVTEDVGPRHDSSLKKLAGLKPIFKKNGSVTHGNSSPVTDGAAGCLVTTTEKADDLGLKDPVVIVDYHLVGLDPKRMGLGPALVIGELMKNNELELDDIDVFEINEAFSAQVLSVLKALDDDGFCKKRLGLKKKLGSIPEKKLNPNGGAIALGHPVGATGARLAVTAAKELVLKKKDRALVALCVSGGLGAGMILERG